MPSTRACAVCLYWHVLKGIEGECRFEAPRLDSRWPKTASKDWCGRFEPVAYLDHAAGGVRPLLAPAPSGALVEEEEGMSRIENDDDRFLRLVQMAAGRESEALSFRDLYSRIKKDTPLDEVAAHDVLQTLVGLGKVRETRDGFWAPVRVRALKR